MYLVTGGSGFCGFEMVRYLLSKNERVRVFDCEPMPVLLPNVEFIQADVRDPIALKPIFNGVTKVIHTIAKVPISKAGREFYRTNVDGTRNVMQASLEAGVSKVVHISSSAVQFLDSCPINEDDPYRTIDDYAASKKEAEDVCAAFIEKGLNISIIRPRTVVGPGRLGIFDILFNWVAAGSAIYVVGTGNNKIQLLHSEDLASACYLASLHGRPSTYNIGARDFSTLNDDLGFLVTEAKTGSRLRHVPAKPVFFLLKLLDLIKLSPLAPWHYASFHKDFYFTNERARYELGWQPKFGNKEIILASYRDYLSHHSDQSTFGTSHRKKLRQGLLAVFKGR